MEKKRRHPLEKENFFEGNRQKWAGIFTVIGLITMLSNAYGFIKDPAPFLQFFLSIGVTFILGASATAVMNSWRTSSTTQNENEDKSIKEEKIEKQEIVERIERPKYYEGEVE